MRVIAGVAKGRKLKAPSSGTRPLTGRIKEALFSSLDEAVVGSAVLDLYAGSGSIGLEALSRGASSAVFVEGDRAVAAVLRSNVDSVDLGGEVVRSDVDGFLRGETRTFDLVFMDPPYTSEPSDVDSTLSLVGPRLNAVGIVVVHRRAKSPEPQVDFPASWRQRKYGDAKLYVFRLEAAS